MKKLLTTIGVVSLLAAITLQAQTAIPVPTITLGGSNLNLTIDTNWMAIPYGIYRTDTHQWGYGGAVLYQVTPYFWTGVRADNISGLSTTAGVQANLQTTVTYDGIAITPFATASTGLGSSTLYASAGVGGAINFHTWAFKIGATALTLSAGAVADYEHVVDGSANFNQVCAGPLLQLTF